MRKKSDFPADSLLRQRFWSMYSNIGKISSTKPYRKSIWRHVGDPLEYGKRFLILEPALRSAHVNILKENVKIAGNGPRDPITPTEKELIRSFISVLYQIENATSLLGRNTEPAIKNVDVFTSGIIGNLNNLVEQEQDQSSVVVTMCKCLKEDIMSRRSRHFAACPMFELFVMVASFLNPVYKSLCYLNNIGGELAYTCTMEKAFYVMYMVDSEIPAYGQSEGRRWFQNAWVNLNWRNCRKRKRRQ